MHVNRKQDIYYTMCTNARVSTYCIQLLIQSISRNDSKQIGNDQHLWKKKKWEDEKEKGDQNASTNEKFNVSCSCSCSCFETRYNGEYTGYIHTHTHIRTDMFTTRAIRSKSNWHKNIKKEIHFHFDHLTRNWNSFPNSKSIVRTTQTCWLIVIRLFLFLLYWKNSASNTERYSWASRPLLFVRFERRFLNTRYRCWANKLPSVNPETGINSYIQIHCNRWIQCKHVQDTTSYDRGMKINVVHSIWMYEL